MQTILYKRQDQKSKNQETDKTKSQTKLAQCEQLRLGKVSKSTLSISQMRASPKSVYVVCEYNGQLICIISNQVTVNVPVNVVTWYIKILTP